MRSFIHQPASRFLFSFVIFFLLFFLGQGLHSLTVHSQETLEKQLERAQMDRELNPVMSETDLYCSFFVLEGKEPAIKIIGADREEEKILFTDSDVVVINRGQKDGLEIGQVFLALEIGPKIGKFGRLALKRGRVRIVFLEEGEALAEVEKSCGQVMVGNYLVPFEEKESFLGKDLGYDVPPKEGEGLKGSIIHLQRDYMQLGSGSWAIIDLGEEEGVYVGQQLIIYTRAKKSGLIKIIGNCMIIDTERKTSTVKILSCKDPIREGYWVQTRLQ